jgi:hypothetical protein
LTLPGQVLAASVEACMWRLTGAWSQTRAVLQGSEFGLRDLRRAGFFRTVYFAKIPGLLRYLPEHIINSHYNILSGGERSTVTRTNVTGKD